MAEQVLSPCSTETSVRGWGFKFRSYGERISLVDNAEKIEMHYHQVNNKDELMKGICNSKPEILENGKIRLLENWEWTSRDKSKGT